MKVLEDLKRVIRLLSEWLTTIKLNNAVGFYDINKFSEGFVAKLLNEIYGYNLKILEYEQINYPGIDLGDEIKKVGFQVSTSRKSKKIYDSLKKFVKGPHRIYTNGIRFLILDKGKKPNVNKAKCMEIYPGFNPVKHIVPFDELLMDIENISQEDPEHFYRIKEIVDLNLAGKFYQCKLIFIGHSHKDKDFVDRLASDLTNEGYRVWIDDTEIMVGESIPNKVKDGISKCDFFCVVISSNSAQSKWVKSEHRMASDALSVSGKPIILSIKIDKTEIPGFLRKDIKYADFSKKYFDGWNQLLKSLKRLPHKPEDEKPVSLSKSQKENYGNVLEVHEVLDSSNFSIKELDDELISRGHEGRIFKFKDKEGTPQRRELFKLVKTAYDRPFSFNRNLNHYTTPELIQKIRQRIKNSNMELRRDRSYFYERLDLFEISNNRVRSNALSIAAVCMSIDLVPTGNDFFKLRVKDYGKTFNLYVNEPFYHQPTAAGRMYTGVLVGEDMIVTAAHFANERDFTDLRFVFDFIMENPITPAVQIPADNIYKCLEIIERVYDPEADWMLVKLDRKVKGREAVAISKRDIFTGQPAYVIGHPCGLPLKYAPGVSVGEITGSYFRADLDVYSGNSGSPVFCAETHELIGIVSREKTMDFRWTQEGWITLRYPKTDPDYKGSQCTKVSEFSSFLHRFEKTRALKFKFKLPDFSKPGIYNVIIEPTKKENLFHITWYNSSTFNLFDQSVEELTPEELEWMWKDRRNQLKIGEKLFRFLDGDSGHLQQALKVADNHAETLQLHLFPCRETANWPFELLAHNGAFLLPHRIHLVRRVPVREITKELPPLPPQNRRLRLLFMACSPLDVKQELDFEQEEEAIFKAAEKLAMDLEVEETGTLAGLREKLQQQQYDIVHLSGHAGIDKGRQPFFVMENESGYREEVTVEKLWQEGLKVNPPRLLFISGGSTGDAAWGIEGAFAQVLVEKYQIPVVLGWGRWISDSEANVAAKVIYKELSRGKSVLDAVQRVRYELHSSFKSVLKPAWPQLRLFSSGGTLDAIVEAEQIPRPQVRRMTHIYLKNSDVKVLGEGFVGRRRQLQQSYRALTQEAEKAGLLILGTGGLGKSCLAGKVSERFKEHTLVIVHGRLNAITLKRALKDAFVVTQDDHGKNVLTWEMEMKELLGVLCRSCFKEKKYLILLDDFEQNLDGWEKGEPGGLLPEAAKLLGVMLDLLPGTGKSTQLMITCRYGFSLHQRSFQTSDETKDQDSARRVIKSFSGSPGAPRRGEPKKALRPSPESLNCDSQLPPSFSSSSSFIIHNSSFHNAPLAAGSVSLEDLDLVKERLEWIWLTGFRDTEQKKKVRELPHISEQMEPSTIDKLLAAGCGNPRLMEWIDVLVGEIGERDKTGVTELLRAVSGKKLEFIQKHVIHELLQPGGKELALFLCWFAVYRRPVLKEGAKEVGEKAGLRRWEDLLKHCIDVGLIEYDRALYSYQVSPLLRDKLLDGLENHIGCHEAAFAYYKSICEGKPDEQFDPLQVEEWIYHAWECGEENIATRQGGRVVNYLRNKLALKESQRVGQWILETKRQELTNENDAFLLNALACTAGDMGHHLTAVNYLEQALKIDRAVRSNHHPNIARELDTLGERWIALGEPKKALECCKQALTIFLSVYNEKHPNVASTFNSLGKAWGLLGNYDRAVKSYQHALSINLEVYNEKHPEVAIIMNNLGDTWRALGEPDKAIDCCQQALIILKDVYGEKHPFVATTINNLGKVWLFLDEYNKAIDYFHHALLITQEVYGEGHPDVGTLLNNIGDSFRALGEPEKAIDYCHQSLNIFKNVFGDNHPYVAGVLNNLGKAWSSLSNYHKAIDYFEKAFSINKAVYGDDHPNVAENWVNWGTALFHLGQVHKANDYFLKAYQTFYQFFGPEHPHIKSVKKWLQLCR